MRIDNVNGVVVGAGDEEASVGGELHVVGIHSDAQRANYFVGRGVDNTDRLACPVGDEETGAVGRKDELVGIDVDGDAGDDLAGLRIEDYDVAGAGASSAIGGIKQVLAG